MRAHQPGSTPIRHPRQNSLSNALRSTKRLAAQIIAIEHQQVKGERAIAR